MKKRDLNSIQTLFFTASQIADALGISQASARVACHRHVRSGVLIRIKRDLYVLADNWKRAGDAERFGLANRIQVPSYVSFTTALAYHQATTQIQPSTVESAATVRSVRVEGGGWTFGFFKLKRSLYFGFGRSEGFFIAAPEKALLDALYLTALGRYRLDTAALDMSRLNRRALKRYARKYPQAVRKSAEALWNH